MNRKAYEYIEHTADAGMRVNGGSLKSLFSNAADGLFEMMAVIDSIDETTSIEIALSADSVEMLFVSWLDELVFRHETDELFLKRAEISHITQNELIAIVHGEPTNFDKHIVYTEIKAITYHQLYVVQNTLGEWEAQVIFDL